MESVLRFMFRPVAAMFPTSWSVPTSVVAQAMVWMARHPAGQEAVTTLENKDIHRIAAAPNKPPAQ